MEEQEEDVESSDSVRASAEEQVAEDIAKEVNQPLIDPLDGPWSILGGEEGQKHSLLRDSFARFEFPSHFQKGAREEARASGIQLRITTGKDSEPHQSLNMNNPNSTQLALERQNEGCFVSSDSQEEKTENDEGGSDMAAHDRPQTEAGSPAQFFQSFDKFGQNADSQRDSCSTASCSGVPWDSSERQEHSSKGRDRRYKVPFVQMEEDTSFRHQSTQKSRSLKLDIPGDEGLVAREQWLNKQKENGSSVQGLRHVMCT